MEIKFNNHASGKAVPSTATPAKIKRHLAAQIMLTAAISLWCLAGSSATPAADSLEHILNASANGYAQAEPSYRLNFPKDHGIHPDFRHEWWYLTGNLHDPQGRHFGYQFTLFRFALAPPTAAQETAGVAQTPTAQQATSAWQTRQIYMAHLAISDSQGRHFYHAERFSRGALGLAEVTNPPLHAWLYDWQLSALTSSSEPPWQLQARATDSTAEIANGAFALNLQIDPGKARVLQGEQGYSRKGDGAASHYYSYPRLPTQGSLQLGDKTFNVSGDSWFDREWGSNTLNPQQQGWDWFALQLADGRELMWYQLRLKEKGIDRASQGVLVAQDGSRQNLDPTQVKLQALKYWAAPDGRCYPTHWRAQFPGLPVMEIQPRLPQQWWDGTFRYWEGAVEVHGELTGQGYLELSGYPTQEHCP